MSGEGPFAGAGESNGTEVASSSFSSASAALPTEEDAFAFLSVGRSLAQLMQQELLLERMEDR